MLWFSSRIHEKQHFEMDNIFLAFVLTEPKTWFSLSLNKWKKDPLHSLGALSKLIITAWLSSYRPHSSDLCYVFLSLLATHIPYPVYILQCPFSRSYGDSALLIALFFPDVNMFWFLRKPMHLLNFGVEGAGFKFVFDSKESSQKSHQTAS
jgi:hypothetical protein